MSLMRGGRNRLDEVEAFLRGQPAQLGSVERAVRITVRSFRFGDPELERDLVQETLSRTLAGVTAQRFQGSASLCTYACNVARYTCLEHIRRRRPEVTFDPELHSARSGSGSLAPEDSFLSVEQHRRNLAAFASLPPECQEVLRMICLEGASYREVASRLGISEAALKSRIHRCRMTCREAAKPRAAVVRLVLDRAPS
jgi:RNA polymerase sigma-70 factor (ECF subfamily)